MSASSFDESLRSSDSFPDLRGQDAAKEQLKSALLMRRHVIIMGPPGVGKTTLARNVAKLLPAKRLNDCVYHCDPVHPVCPDCKAGKTEGSRMVKGEERFVRVQGSPDLTSEDLLGDIDPIKAITFGPFSLEAFTPGKIFKANEGVLFFDELNRAPERLQNALLQVLEERKVTIGNYDLDFQSNFIFIGTMNPQDASTEKISDVLLDRFDIVYLAYPESLATEIAIVKSRGQSLIAFPDELLTASVNFVRTLRAHPQLERFPSVRATIGVYERAQALASLRGHDEVGKDDVRDAIISVLAHRIALKASIKYLKEPQELLADAFEKAFNSSLAPTQKGGDR